MSFHQLIERPSSNASPWLIKFRTDPTLNATQKARRGVPSETAQASASF
jgi:hypothetical protein